MRTPPLLWHSHAFHFIEQPTILEHVRDDLSMV